VPTQFPHGIETPVTVLTDADGVGWGVVVDNGDLLTYQDHASPRPSPEVLRQRIEAAKQDSRQFRVDTRAIRTNAIAQIDLVKGTTNAPSAFPSLPSGFTAAQNRALVNDLRRELIDTQREVKDLAGIVRQMLRDQKD
jgi:hypothetical protein